MHAWNIDITMILTIDEIRRVLRDLNHRAKRSVNSRQNRVVFRLATCCGLRASEICGLRLSHVHVGIDRPYLYIPKTIAKGQKARRVPLWWDAGTLADLTAWKAERQQQGAGPSDWFVCSQAKGSFGHRLDRRNARQRFLSACRVLGPYRVRELTIHHGRHSFCSHALARGRTLAEVRDAAGHANVSTTSTYTHVCIDDDGTVGEIFSTA